MTDDFPEEVRAAADSWIAEQQMRDLESYVARGRRFQHLSVDELNGRWVAHFRDWAATCREKARNPEAHDVEAEFSLRDARLPQHLVAQEWASLREALADAIENMDEDAKRDLNREIMGFRAAEQGRRN